jgi:hypothetical protein
LESALVRVKASLVVASLAVATLAVSAVAPDRAVDIGERVAYSEVELVDQDIALDAAARVAVVVVGVVVLVVVFVALEAAVGVVLVEIE